MLYRIAETLAKANCCGFMSATAKVSGIQRVPYREVLRPKASILFIVEEALGSMNSLVVENEHELFSF